MKRKILIVEDNEMLQRAYAHTFREWDARIVDSVEQAVPEVTSWKPEAVISDFHLAGPLHGGILYETCQRICPETPFVLVTSVPHAELRAYTRAVHFQKPCSLRDVEAHVKVVVGEEP